MRLGGAGELSWLLRAFENLAEDPEPNLVMRKKAYKFKELLDLHGLGKDKKCKTHADYFKQRCCQKRTSCVTQAILTTRQLRLLVCCL
ncbi:hypothetical protein FHG87_010517 [Trinorchestia longiramus]|nr:hypothetical protein FHG87_010517 [Trinorchestia longiramus]